MKTYLTVASAQDLAGGSAFRVMQFVSKGLIAWCAFMAFVFWPHWYAGSISTSTYMLMVSGMWIWSTVLVGFAFRPFLRRWLKRDKAMEFMLKDKEGMDLLRRGDACEQRRDELPSALSVAVMSPAEEVTVNVYHNQFQRQSLDLKMAQERYLKKIRREHGWPDPQTGPNVPLISV